MRMMDGFLLIRLLSTSSLFCKYSPPPPWTRSTECDDIMVTSNAVTISGHNGVS